MLAAVVGSWCRKSLTLAACFTQYCASLFGQLSARSFVCAPALLVFVLRSLVCDLCCALHVCCLPALVLLSAPCVCVLSCLSCSGSLLVGCMFLLLLLWVSAVHHVVGVRCMFISMCCAHASYIRSETAECACALLQAAWKHC